MCLERQGEHAGQIAFRVPQLLIGYDLVAQPVQLGFDRLHSAVDVFRVDAGPRCPHRAVASSLELARRVVGQPLPVAGLRPESAHQAESTQDEISDVESVVVPVAAGDCCNAHRNVGLTLAGNRFSNEDRSIIATKPILEISGSWGTVPGTECGRNCLDHTRKLPDPADYRHRGASRAERSCVKSSNCVSIQSGYGIARAENPAPERIWLGVNGPPQ